jgi:hypothetical protein
MIMGRFGEASLPLSENVAENRDAGCSASRHRAPVLPRCLASVAGDLGYNEPMIATLFIHKARPTGAWTPGSDRFAIVRRCISSGRDSKDGASRSRWVQ